MTLRILDSGSCELFKGCVHGAALGLVALMGAYNAAAWIRRGQRHLAINTVIYGAAAIWEWHHVAHHHRSLCEVRAAASPERSRPVTADAPRAA